MNAQRHDHLTAVVKQLGHVMYAFRDASRPGATRLQTIDALALASAVLSRAAYDVQMLRREIEAVPSGDDF